MSDGVVPTTPTWLITCSADRIPEGQTYATEQAANEVIRLHSGGCPGEHGVVPPHLWVCGCLVNGGGAHRVGCPVFPEGIRGDD